MFGHAVLTGETFWPSQRKTSIEPAAKTSLKNGKRVLAGADFKTFSASDLVIMM